MKLESQVASLELSKRLKELGCGQESLYYHIFWDWNLYGLMSKEAMDLQSKGESIKFGICRYSAYTSAELGEKLPSYEEYMTPSTPDNPPEGDSNGIEIWHRFYNRRWESSFGSDTYFPEINDELPVFRADTEADARAKMLVWLLERGIIKPNE